MKSLTYLLIIMCYCLSSEAQNSRFVSRMAPIYEAGYYVNFKGDTIKGWIQTNQPKETDVYAQFYFKGAGKSKPRLYTAQRVKAYGYGERHFVKADMEGQNLFVERLVTGRLRLYEFRHPGKVNGYTAIESDYYIKDSRPENANAHLKELKRIPKKFYKKALKPYFQDQPMIWTDLDKYNFDKNSILSSIKEFNRFYETNSK